MTALDVGVICLAAGLVDGVGGVGVAGGSGAGGVGFGMEFGSVVSGRCLEAGFVLFMSVSKVLRNPGWIEHTPPCSIGALVGFTPGLNSPCLGVATESMLLSSLMMDV